MYRLNQPHGSGALLVSWRPRSSTHIATTGCDLKVTIIDRQGELQESIQLENLCIGFGWDSEGDILAIVAHNSSSIILWHATINKKSTVDTGVRDDITFITWARKEPLLAVGTQKGNLVIYDHVNAK